MIRLVSVCCVAVALLMAPAMTVAEDASLLRHIPADALGFAVVNDLGQVDAKLAPIRKMLGVPAEPGVFEAMGLSAELRAAVDPKRSLLVAVTPPEPGAPEPGAPEPGVVVFLPVPDYAALAQAMGEDDTSGQITESRFLDMPVLLAKKDDWALLTMGHQRKLMQRMLQAYEPVELQLDGLAAEVAEADVAMVLTRAGIKLSTAMGRQGLAAAKAEMKQMDVDLQDAVEASFDMYDTMLASVANQVESVALFGKLDEGGDIRVIERIGLVRGEKMAEWVGDVQTDGFAPLAVVPAGRFAFAGGGPLPGKAMSDLTEMSLGIMSSMRQFYGLDEKALEKFQKLSTPVIAPMRALSMTFGVGEPGKGIYARSTAVVRVDDAKKYLADYEAYVDAAAELSGDSETSILHGMTSESIDVDGKPGLCVTMQPPKMDDLPEMQAVMGTLFGPDGKLATYMVALDDHTIVAAYVSRENLRRAIEAYEDPEKGLAADPALAATLAELPDDAPWQMAFSLTGYFEMIRGIIAGLPDADAIDLLPSFPESPPIGIAATTAEAEVRIEVFMPGELWEAIGRLSQPPQAPTKVEARGL